MILRGKTVHQAAVHQAACLNTQTDIYPTSYCCSCLYGGEFHLSHPSGHETALSLRLFRHARRHLREGRDAQRDFRTDVCYVKKLSKELYEGVLRSAHDIRNARRSTSATSVFVSPSSIYLCLPFLTTKTDHNLHINIVEFVKLMVDEPRTPDGDPPSKCNTMEQLLDILSLGWYNQTIPKYYLQCLTQILHMDANLPNILKQSRHTILLRLG